MLFLEKIMINQSGHSEEQNSDRIDCFQLTLTIRLPDSLSKYSREETGLSSSGARLSLFTKPSSLAASQEISREIWLSCSGVFGKKGLQSCASSLSRSLSLSLPAFDSYCCPFSPFSGGCPPCSASLKSLMSLLTSWVASSENCSCRTSWQTSRYLSSLWKLQLSLASRQIMLCGRLPRASTAKSRSRQYSLRGYAFQIASSIFWKNLLASSSSRLAAISSRSCLAKWFCSNNREQISSHETNGKSWSSSSFWYGATNMSVKSSVNLMPVLPSAVSKFFLKTLSTFSKISGEFLRLLMMSFSGTSDQRVLGSSSSGTFRAMKQIASHPSARLRRVRSSRIHSWRCRSCRKLGGSRGKISQKSSRMMRLLPTSNFRPAREVKLRRSFAGGWRRWPGRGAMMKRLRGVQKKLSMPPARSRTCRNYSRKCSSTGALRSICSPGRMASARRKSSKVGYSQKRVTILRTSRSSVCLRQSARACQVGRWLLKPWRRCRQSRTRPSWASQWAIRGRSLSRWSVMIFSHLMRCSSPMNFTTSFSLLLIVIRNSPDGCSYHDIICRFNERHRTSSPAPQRPLRSRTYNSDYYNHSKTLSTAWSHLGAILEPS